MLVFGTEREKEIIGSERNLIENDLISKLECVTSLQSWSAIRALDDILATQSFIKGSFPTSADTTVFKSLSDADAMNEETPKLQIWFRTMEMIMPFLTKEVRIDGCTRDTEEIKPLNFSDVLPNELLLKIFAFLPFRALKNVLLVCRRWRDVGEDTKLWEWAALKVRPTNFKTKLECTRFSYIKVHGFAKARNRSKLQNQLFLLLDRLPQVKKVSTWNSLNFPNVSEDTSESPNLASLLKKLEVVRLGPSHSGLVTQNQLKALCKNSRLKNLSFAGVNLCEVGMDILASAIARTKHVEFLDIRHTLSDIKMKVIFNEIEKVSNLEYLRLSGSGGMSAIKTIEPTVLGRVVSNLVHFQMENCGSLLTSDQVVQLLEHVCHKPELRLATLIIPGVSLLGVSRDTLASAVCRVENVRVSGANMNDVQLAAILEKISKTSNLKLRFLDIGSPVLTLPTVNPNVLASAMCRLTELQLNSEVSVDQLGEILKLINVEADLKLTKLYLSCRNFWAVDPAELATAVNKVKVMAVNGLLSGSQFREIFEGIGEKKSKLKSLSIENQFNVYAVDLSSVPILTVARGINELEEFYIKLCNMSLAMYTAVAMQAVLHATNLKFVECHSDQFSQWDLDVELEQLVDLKIRNN